ncbi:hypothetical protein HK105_201021 [Polyrhizophydium stewartii]|uniref:Uncharacterized protein n=1 Tax=Polyrhizophydium stewartii TaxID=2732419 RepID=A0ABR4NIN8_9FUNG|nr:hypothetical protein HK105_005875 [Polyrhizophydium stewartii]
MTTIELTHKFVVGIDFGTTYSGFAWASVEQPDEVRGYNDWENQPSNTPYCKTITSIRYRREPDGTYTPVYWGGELIEIKKFKLWFNPETPRDGLPEDMNWMRPSIDYLRFISNQALEVLRHRFFDLDKNDVLWCITVPAIWDERAKNLVRQAATLAGIVNDSNQNSLCIILEPEAAALYTLKAVSELSSKSGSTYMILDAGGGTVDLTTHTITGNSGMFRSDSNGSSAQGGRKGLAEAPRLTEASRGTGALCGSTYVDKSFLKFFRAQIGTEHFNEMKRKRPELLAALLQEWERAKRDFLGPPPPGQEPVPEIIPFPAGMLQFVSDETKQRWIDEQDTEEELHVPVEQMMEIFHEPVNECLKLVQEQLESIGGQCDYLVLVGGFSSSRYLCKRVNERFAPYFRKIVVPLDPTAAVVQGAVVYGLDPSRIQVRRCRYSYGYISNIAITDIDRYAERDVWQNEAGERFVRVFKCLVAENQEVKANEEFFSSAYPMYATQTRAQVRLVATPMRLEPGRCFSYRMVRDVTELGILATDVPTHLPNRLVNIRYLFGQTELKAIATIVATGQEQQMSLVIE